MFRMLSDDYFKVRLSLVLALWSFFTFLCSAQEPLNVSIYEKDTLFMGSAFVFKAVSENKEHAGVVIEKAMAEVNRIEKLISSWDENSQTYAINDNAGIRPVKVDYELFNLIRRSIKVSTLTNGYFDISFASIDKVWDFKKSYDQPPSGAAIAASVRKVNYQNIVLNSKDTSVYLKEKGMKIGFGAIGKGYAANRAKMVMEEQGVLAGVVNAGGDLLSWGSKPDGSPWSVGVVNPLEKNEVLLWLNSTNMAVVTSGDYERFVMINGVRYGHIINPKTGWPTKGLTSVTVICPDAELADALATSVFVMGRERGLELINLLEGIEAVIVDDQGNLFLSENVAANYVLK
ncbi:MAG: FAD:protein FMN transferase [Schleiferiaceae bacterium]|nr:FAD:protein FMN transferase [Schleiferiaceae bacterium]